MIFNTITEAFKLVRRGDPETSHEAAEMLDVTAMERVVYEAIKTFGHAGCISDEVIDALPGYRYSTVTARYKQLKEKGWVIVDGRKMKASSGRFQQIMWAKDYYREDADHG